MSEKHLTEPPWKNLVAKQGVKDIGLQKALAGYARIEAAKESGKALEALAEICELALKLKKTYAAKEEVVDHLNEMLKEVKKITPALEARSKATTYEVANAPEKKLPVEDDAEEAAEAAKFKKDLKQQMISALAQVKTRAPGDRAQEKEPKPQLKFMAYIAGKSCAVIVARKVGSATKKLLVDIAKVATGGKFYDGECIFEKNMHTFVLESVPPGLAKMVTTALQTETEQKYKIRMRSIDGSVVLDSDTDSDSNAPATAAPDPAAAPQPASADTGIFFKQRLEALLPKIKEATAAATPAAEQIKLQIGEAGELAKKKDFIQANQRLTAIEALLKNGDGAAAAKQIRFAPIPKDTPRPSGGVKIGGGRRRSGVVIAPAAPVQANDFVGTGGRKLTVAKSPTGGVRFTAPAPPVREITFSGGGAKGSALPGAVKALQSSGVLKDAKKIAGASVGSMSAALIAAGATSEEFNAVGNDDATTARIVEGTGGTKMGLLFAAIKNKVTTGSGSPLTGQGLENLVRDVLDETLRKRMVEYMEQCGKDSKAPDEYVVKIAKRLSGNKAGPTFLDYRLLSKAIPAIKEIVITGTYTEEFTTDDKGKKSSMKEGNQEGQLYVFDADSEPEMEVAVAVHASASFPFAFKPVDIKLSSGLTVRFIDGGVMNNTPTSSSIGNERKLEAVPESRAMTFVFEDSDGTTGGLLKGKVTPAQGFKAKVIDWFVGSNNNAAEYAKNRDMADRPEEIVVVPLKIALPPKKKGGKAQQVDMRDGTLNFGLSADAKLALQAATETATQDQITRENKPKALEFASDSQMFVSISMADLKTLADSGYKGAKEALAFREKVAATIGKLREAVKNETAKPGGRIANLVKDKNAKAMLDELGTLAGANADFQGYVGRELNKQTELDTLLDAIRKGGLKGPVLEATFMVSDALKVHTWADNVLKELVYPKMKYEKKGGTAIEVLFIVEKLLRAAKTPDEYNAALTSAINHFKNKSDKSIPHRGHKKFAQELERRLMRTA
jgi:predicted acylesterase/phospholipase RssA